MGTIQTKRVYGRGPIHRPSFFCLSTAVQNAGNT